MGELSGAALAIARGFNIDNIQAHVLGQRAASGREWELSVCAWDEGVGLVLEGAPSWSSWAAGPRQPSAVRVILDNRGRVVGR